MFIRFQWIDSQTWHGWRQLKEAKDFDLDPIESVGWVIWIHKHSIMISSDFSGNGNVDNITAIPIKMISKICIIEGMGFDVNHGPPSEI